MTPDTSLFNSSMIFVAQLIAILISLTIHEFAHAYFAFKQGDPTAKLMGRLSLNPLVHIDAIGLLMLLFVHFGWAKPVPINPIYFKNKKWGEAIVSIAGPLTNLLLVVVFGIILKIIWSTGNFDGNNLMIIFLSNIVIINIILCVFNLIPIPPLDGSHVLFSILPESLNDFKYQLVQKGPMILMAIIILDSVFNLGIFGPLFNFLSGVAYKLIFF